MEQDLIPMEQNTDIPVYLFTGFLESGKTKFIQETFEDKRFDNGERTLLIVTEEGEEEYDPSRFVSKKVVVRYADDESEFTQELLEQWQFETGCERVVIEWNGMWMLDTLYGAMPDTWVVYQEFMFADASTFENYNANMRQLMFDKLRSCEMVVLNRFDRKWDIMPFHKIIRAVNRACDIAYEDLKGKVKYDDIEDPLPFDKNAPVIVIEDNDYAIWYRDLNEELKSYNGKTVRFKAQIALTDELPDGDIVVGRQLMNCCANDIQFAGLIASGCDESKLESNDWVLVTAGIKVQKHAGYTKPGPVLYVKEISKTEAPADEVATFN